MTILAIVPGKPKMYLQENLMDCADCACLTNANYCNLPSFSFGQALGKLQGKVLTHSENVGWWKTLMMHKPFLTMLY